MEHDSRNHGAGEAFAELERSVRAALETYSNVHRGSGHHSMASTHLFEQARRIVLDHLGLGSGSHVVIFSTPRGADALTARLETGRYRTLSSRDIGLPLGVRALAVDRRALPGSLPFRTGGGTARLVAPDWVMWAAAPDRFEAGTPAIVNVIAFAKALLLTRRLGADAFRGVTDSELTAAGIVRDDDLDPYSGRELLHRLRQTMIGRGLSVPTVGGMRPFVNLDNGASTPAFEPVWAAVRRTWRQPAEVHEEVVRAVRSVVADFLGAPPTDYDVIFTSNTTEAINLVAESESRDAAEGAGWDAGRDASRDAAEGAGWDAGRGTRSVVVNTLLEHNSNELPWRMVTGSSPIRVPMDAEGLLDLGELEAHLRAHNERGEHGRARIGIVAVSGASNVLGVFNDLAGIGRVVHRYGARLLVDAAQLVAHREVAMERCGIDYLAFSAHKAYAPFGTGVLVARKGLLRFSPAEMERIRASGEENVGGIAALGKALDLLRRIGLDVIREEEQALTARALVGMGRIPGLKVYGIANPESASFARKGGVIPFDLKGVISHRVARELAARGGIGVRSGCHCAHLTVKRMLGVPPWAERLQGLILTVLRRFDLPGVVRVSLGLENSEEDVDTLIRVLADLARQRKGGSRAKAIRALMDEFSEAASRRVYAQ